MKMTPQERKALKLALEAFKLIAAQDQGCGGNVSEAEAWRSAQSIALANITIIKEALAQSKEHLPNMSEINRTIAYSAAATLHELGYEWKDSGWITQQKEPEQEPDLGGVDVFYPQRPDEIGTGCECPNCANGMGMCHTEEAQPEQEPVALYENIPTFYVRDVNGAYVEDSPLNYYITPPQRKPLTDGLPCCGYTDATAIKWNEFNHAVQCHNCGHTYTKTSNEPLTLEYIDQHIGADEGDREAVVALVREVEAAHGIKE